MRSSSFLSGALACLLVSLLLCLGASAQAPATPAPPADPHALFADKGCAHCHGPDAAGSDKGPDLRPLGHKMKPDEIRHQIVDGGKEMPAFGDALSPEETDALVAWVHNLKPMRKSKSPR